MLADIVGKDQPVDLHPDAVDLSNDPSPTQTTEQQLRVLWDVVRRQEAELGALRSQFRRLTDEPRLSGREPTIVAEAPFAVARQGADAGPLNRRLLRRSMLKTAGASAALCSSGIDVAADGAGRRSSGETTRQVVAALGATDCKAP